MKRFITASIMAMLFTAGVAFAQERNNGAIYVINKRVVANFDGSQLVNKTIASYEIDVENNVHMIITADYANTEECNNTQVVSKGGKVTIISIDDKGNYEGSLVTRPGTVYVIDGEVSSMEKFVSIFPSKIESMSIYKLKWNETSPEIKKYAKEDTEVVMMITTKK